MDRPSAELLARMPLAQAVLALGQWAVNDDHLASLFERHRGRCYEKVISFPVMVQLIADALLEHAAAATRAFPGLGKRVSWRPPFRRRMESCVGCRFP
ncbi:MAG: hypothetical protein WC975_12080 [Phycisphaerae bacterium]